MTPIVDASAGRSQKELTTAAAITRALSGAPAARSGQTSKSAGVPRRFEVHEEKKVRGREFPRPARRVVSALVWVASIMTAAQAEAPVGVIAQTNE
jgi:hypothetical protein